MSEFKGVATRIIKTVARLFTFLWFLLSLGPSFNIGVRTCLEHFFFIFYAFGLYFTNLKEQEVDRYSPSLYLFLVVHAAANSK